MGTLKGVICVALAVITLIALYVCGSVLGWLLAATTVILTVLGVITLVVTLVSYCIWEAWTNHKQHRRKRFGR